MGKIIYEGEDELVEPVRNLLTGGGVYDIQPEHDWFVVCLRLDGALTPSRERQWIIFGKKLDIEDYADRRSVLRSMPQEIRDARAAAKQVSRVGAYAATTVDLETVDTEPLQAFAKELVDFVRAKVKYEFETELAEIRAVFGFSADFEHASLLGYLNGLRGDLAEERRNREALYDENGRAREALGVEIVADLAATINAIYDAAGIKPRTARTLIRYLQGLMLDEPDEPDELGGEVPSAEPITDEVKRLIFASARRAASVFIGQMAKEWPDPDALLDGLWDDNVDDLCSDLDAVASPARWAEVEALWRAEVKRIYEEGR